ADAAPAPTARLVRHHLQWTTPFNRYRTIDEDCLERPLEILRLVVPPALLGVDSRPGDDPPDEVRAGARALLDEAVAVEVSLHDHGIALLDASFDLEAAARRLGWALDPARLDHAQQAAVDLAGSIAHQLRRDAIVPLLRALTAADPATRIVGARTDHEPSGTDRREDGQVMWTARALIADRAALEADPEGVGRHLRHWIKDAPQDDAGVPPALAEISRDLHVIAEAVVGPAVERPPAVRAEDRLVAGEIDHVTRWLNYVYVRGGPGGTAFVDEWTALRDAQLFYAALDRVDDDLTDVLSRALGAGSDRELGTLRRELEHTSQRALLVEMDRRDVAKYLKRSVLAEMDQILDGWAYDELVKDTVALKVDACRERLDELKALRQERLGVYTDVILFTIGVTAILGTALALVTLVRETASDARLGAYDVGRDGLSGWFASQPLDAIVVASLLLSVVLLVVYVGFRHRQR
ncbi:MAG: hypothetical protein KDB10_23555, partial [Acidimicrobiales bacterium]|nr:hypothetical protein [Acidimicrobiales bacterium]